MEYLRTKVNLISQRVDEKDKAHGEARIGFYSNGGLEQMLEEFEAFLRACGYHFEGSLIIEPPETVTKRNK